MKLLPLMKTATIGIAILGFSSLAFTESAVSGNKAYLSELPPKDIKTAVWVLPNGCEYIRASDRTRNAWFLKINTSAGKNCKRYYDFG